ncbi:MAG: peptidylprolyl isomerase [Candidatus Krumholzibacteriia bacterium]
MIGAREAKILFLLVLFAVGGCGKGNEPGKVPGERAGEIVRVGDAVLTGDDLNKLVPEGEQIPPTMEERREFVRRWVDTEVLRQEAIRRGLKTDPYVEARLRELEQQFLADHLVFTELRKRTAVSEEEIEGYYVAHEREYMNEYRVSQILVGTPEEAERVIELLKTRSWAWVANRYTIDPSAKRGGDLGYLTKGNMIPELEAIVFDMKLNDVTGGIKSDFGYHIFRLDDVREALVSVGLDDMREQIMNTLMLEKRKKAYREFLDSLKANADIKYKDESYLRPAESGPQTDTSGAYEDADTAETP